MRVLLVTAEYPPANCGGIGIFYRSLASHLAALGADVRVLAADPDAGDETRQTDDIVEVRRVALPALGTAKISMGRWSFDGSVVRRSRAFSAAARRLTREARPDIVETHDWSAPLWRAPAKPFVVRLHGSSSALSHAMGKRAPRLQRMLEGRMLAQASRIIGVSEWVRAKSSEVFGIDPKRIDLLANGVDVELFSPSEAVRRDEVVYAGTLREDKGVPELLQALEIVLERRPSARATLAGGPEGWRALSPRIRAAVERVQMKAPNRLRLLGRIPQEHLASLYRKAGVCVFPSYVESFGLACVEAMSCGAAVAASRLAAGAEIVEEGRSGLLIDPRDPSGMAETLLRVLGDTELRRTLGAGGRRRAVERYSIRMTAEKTLALYEDALRSKEPWLKTRVA